MATTLVNSYSMYDTNFDVSTLKDKPVQSKNNELGKFSTIALAAAAATLVNPVWDHISDITLPSANSDHTLSIPVGNFDQQVYLDFGQSIPEKINSFLEYDRNWDGYDGVTPSSEAINEAILFFNHLPMGVREPRPGLSGDGEIGLFWEFDRIFIDIGFLGDKTYAIYAKDQDGIEYFKDDVGINEPLPEALKNLIII